MQVKVGNDSRNTRLVFQSRLNGGQRLAAWLRIRRRQSLNHQHNLVNKWRMKTAAQLLPNRFRLAPFNAGCRLQMTFGVK